MNLVRHELGLSDKAERFPLKGTCLAVYSRAVNAADPLEEVLRRQFPWCAQWEADLRGLFEAYVDAKQRQHVLDYDDLLLYWAELMQVPELASEIGGLFDHVLVDEYQDTNALQAAILLGLKPDGAGLDRRRRRRPGDLRLPRRDGAQHPRLPAPVRAAGHPRHAGAELPLDARHPRRPPTPSSASPVSASPRTCVRCAVRARSPRSSRCSTMPRRRAS